MSSPEKNTQSAVVSIKTANQQKTSSEISRVSAAEFPNRYVIRDMDGEKVLSCVEAPNLIIQIKFGLSVSAAAMNKSAPGTIYLDGVAQNGPLLDNAKQIYNFDHHEGCVRAFTVSTCEQVLIMLKKGLDLRTQEWKIIANDPDLDTVLAIWLLLNHIRIHEQESIRQHILFPLIRLEGSIDALGLEMRALTGLSPGQMNQSQRIINHLRRKEVRMKKDGNWGEKTDFLTYTAEILYDMDQIMYKPEKFGKLLGIEELARVNLPGNRVAVAVQSDMGIYEIEALLKKIYGRSIGLVILRRTPSAYTLRQMDPFLSGSLEDVYEKLNYMDPAVKGRSTDRWGGSSDIGGSPRDRGTRLSPEEIVKGCRDAFQQYTFTQQTLQFMFVIVLAAAVLGISFFLTTHQQPSEWIHVALPGALGADPYLRFSLVLILLTAILLATVSKGHLWEFGILSPMGKNWWFALPIAILGAFAGGAGMQMTSHVYRMADISRLLLAGLLLAFASEFLFRGVLHGILARKSRIQNGSSKYLISWPNMGTALLYAVFLNGLPLLHSKTLNLYSISLKQSTTCVAAFFFSLVLGSVRERSHSFFSSFFIHFITLLAILFLPDLLISAGRILYLS